MINAIEVKDLKRNYSSTIGIIKKKKKNVEALKGISFTVKKGEIFGLLGPNGAGKTTTIKILTTLLAPTSGTAKVLGLDAFGEEKKLRPRINFIYGGERSLYWRLSARDNLDYFSDLYKIDPEIKAVRIPKLLELVGLTDRADYKVETFSKGMKQRLQIARGLINDPEILFLDEPTIGLDPTGALELRKIINALSDQGKTILLTTHYMHEADELCDRIAIINNGEIIALDTPENLKRNHKQDSVIELDVSKIDSATLTKLKGKPAVTNLRNIKSEGFSTIGIHTEKPYAIIGDIIKDLEESNIMKLNVRNATLEDIYITLVGDSNAG